MKPDFAAAVRQLDDQAASAGLPGPAEARVRGRLNASVAERRRLWRYPALAIASCAVGMLLVSWLSPRPKVPQELAGFRVELASPGLASTVDGAQLDIRAGAVTLFDAQWDSTLRVDKPSTLRKEPRGLRVVRGQVEVAVKKRAAGAAPVRVLVSGGEIEVHGTRFLVEQKEAGGEVRLLEGHIVFRDSAGREVELQPGQSLLWPLPPLTPPPLLPVVPPADDPQSAAAAAPDQSLREDDEALAPLPPGKAAVAERHDDEWAAHDRLLRAHTLLERIPKLRHAGRSEQAVAELQVAMKQDLPAAARERLSLQLVELYSTELWDVERGCRQVKDHLWRYPAGRYDDEVQRLRAQLGCR